MPFEHNTGGCSCGRVRYRLLDTALIVHACHCRACQRQTGSTNVVNVLIEAGKVEHLSGSTSDRTALTPSGHGQVITRCSTCHDAVWSEYRIFREKRGVPVRFIRAGTLDHPERFPPDVHIFTETRQPWVRLDNTTPQFSALYDLSQVWSKSSLKRISPPEKPESTRAINQSPNTITSHAEAAQ